MKKYKLFTLLVLFLFAISAPAFAGNTNDLAYVGVDELDTESSPAPTDGVIVYDPTSYVPMQGVTINTLLTAGDGTTSITGYGRAIEVHNTTDQTAVLASECGKTFIAMQNTKFQLPAVANGLYYTFVAGANIELEIQVATTPATIVWFDADGNGNGVVETSINTTGNTVVLASDGTKWYAFESEGVWETGGAWTQLDLGAQ